jgi:hypothetical protein
MDLQQLFLQVERQAIRIHGLPQVEQARLQQDYLQVLTLAQSQMRMVAPSHAPLQLLTPAGQLLRSRQQPTLPASVEITVRLL